MSMHKSLRVNSKLGRTRSVFRRWERIEKLRAQEKFGEEQSVFGLPKVATPRAKKKK